jgi:hypothetical protein
MNNYTQIMPHRGTDNKYSGAFFVPQKTGLSEGSAATLQRQLPQITPVTPITLSASSISCKTHKWKYGGKKLQG